MEFGLSMGQSGSIFVQMSSLFATAFPLWPPMPASGRRRASPRVATAGDPRRPRADLILAVALEASRSNRSFPFLELGRPNRTDSPPSAAPATAHHSASIRRARSRADSPSTHSDHPRARTSPYPDRIEHRRRPPSPFPSSFAIAVELPLPAIFRPKSTHGELNRGPLLLPDPILAGIRHHRPRSAAAPPWNAPPATCSRRRLPLLQPVRCLRAP
jgi:hypothetical protein